MSADTAARGGTAVWITALAGVLLVMIHTPAICRRGEAREGLVVRDIVHAGHWVLPVRNGILASKPPLYHWIAATTAQVVGLSDAVVRLPSALAALALAGLTFSLGAAMGGRRRAWLALGVLLGCFVFWRAATEARVDMLFATCITGSLAAFWRWHERGTPRAQLACYAGAAAAVLTKGPAGAVLPALVIAVFLGSRRDWRRLRALGTSPLLAVAAVPVAVWYALAYRVGGDAFVARQLVSENVDRFVGRSNFVNRRSHKPLKLIVQFLGHLLPWNVALLPVWQESDDDGATRRFLHVWWIVILAVFSIAAGKRGVYLLPLYPAVALLAARWLDRRVRLPEVWLAAAFVLVDLGVAAATQASRIAIARTDRITRFAAHVARTVPAGVPLAAAPAALENDVLVVAYLLDRPIHRAPLRCTPGAGWLVPIEAPADGRPGAAPHTDATVLLVCDGAPGSSRVAQRAAADAPPSDSAPSSRPPSSDP